MEKPSDNYDFLCLLVKRPLFLTKHSKIMLNVGILISKNINFFKPYKVFTI